MIARHGKDGNHGSRLSTRVLCSSDALGRHHNGWAFLVSPAAIGVALGSSLMVGLFFGVWPARRAARLNPIEALRYE